MIRLIEKRWPVLCTALMVTVLVQGCASLNREECLVADWRLIGYQDGVAGKSAARVGSYREDCAKHAVVPDLAAYQAGREQGLLEYCRPDNGYRVGQSGQGYPAVCSSATEVDFRKAYEAGREIHLARAALNSTQKQIDAQRQLLRSLEHDREHMLSELVSDGIRREQRVLLLYQVHETEAEIRDVEVEIDALEHEYRHQQAGLEQIRQRHAY